MLTCRDPGISHLIIIGTMIVLFEEKKKKSGKKCNFAAVRFLKYLKFALLR